MIEVQYMVMNSQKPMENGAGLRRFREPEDLILFIQERNAQGTVVAVVQINEL